MKIFGNARNLLTGAVISALNPTPSTAIYRSAMSGTGGGKVRGVGTYTAQNDGLFEIEVLNDTITGTPRISQPVHTGVGNPSISNVAASGGTAAQSFTITLADLGTETRKAYTPFQGFTLRAKTAGEDANNIAITISESGLVRTATDRALLADLVAGTNEYAGGMWDFGGRPRHVDGTIPVDTVRISFGDDPQVYRQYKVFTAGEYQYSFTPAPLRAVPSGSRVFSVTGGRTITVRHLLGYVAPAFVAAATYAIGDLVQPTTPNGHWYEATSAGIASTEPTWSTTGGSVTTGAVSFIDRGQHTRTYASVITLFDALTAIQGDSASLIEVVEPVVNDLNFGGMGITDLSVRTGAFVQSIVRDGTNAIRTANLSVSVADNSPTEEFTIRCNTAGTFNAETFTVTGTVSGEQAILVTGVPYVTDTISLTVPLQIPPDIAPNTEISAALKSSATETKPILCLDGLYLGALAQPRTFTYEWEIRTPDCECSNDGVIGGPNPILLGVDPGVADMSTLPAALKPSAEDLYDWFNEFVAANTEILAGSAGEVIEYADSGGGDVTAIQQAYSAVLKVDRIDILAATKAKDIFYSTLRRVYDENADTIPSAAQTLWDAALVDLETEFGVIDAANFGANFWSDYGTAINDQGAGAAPNLRIPLAKKIFTQEFDSYLDRYRARMYQVLIAADIEPPFGDPTSTGSGPWVDQNGAGWFVATDSPLLPIQPGYGYHSAVFMIDEYGQQVAVSTQQFYIGVNIGCIENLKPGDRLTVTIGDTGTSVRGYQIGDNVRVQVVAGSAAQLGGGQLGNDTQTWSVVGSVAGALDDYALLKSTPPVYSDGGLSFKITPGPIASELGDRFVTWVEGGQIRWRKDGGSWNGPTQIDATVVLSDGVSAAFDAGAAPSFVVGDTFAITAVATNSGSRLKSLTYGGIATTAVSSKHVIDVRPAAPKAASEILIMFRDPTEVGAVVTVRGFANVGDADGTEITEGVALTNGSPSLSIALDDPDAVCAKFTVTYATTANTPASLGWAWLFIGDAHTMLLQDNRIRDFGEVTQTWRRPRQKNRRSALGVDASFTVLSQQSVEDFRYLMDYAAGEDDGRVAILVRDSVPPPSGIKDAFGTALTAYSETGIVTIPDDSIEISDAFQFQPTADKSALSIRMRMEPV